MTSVAVFVRLDYHQDSVRVCVMNSEGRILTNRNLANDAAGIRGVVEAYGPVRGAAIEACCGAAELAEELRHGAGWPIELAHPGYVARIKQSPDKTDSSDAHLLADLVRIGYLPKVWLAPSKLRQLRRLVRHRQQLVRQRRNTKLRIRALLRDKRIRQPAGLGGWTKRFLHWLRTLPELVEEDRWLMDQHLRHLEQWHEEISGVEARLGSWAEGDAVIQKLLTFAGVGLVTAITMRAEIGCFDRFRTSKQLARFCGVTPRNASSGQRQADAGLIKAGNPGLRTVLIELAHRLICRLKGHWSDLGYRLLQKGKPKNVVVAAVANRWIRWLYHQVQPAALLAA